MKDEKIPNDDKMAIVFVEKLFQMSTIIVNKYRSEKWYGIDRPQKTDQQKRQQWVEDFGTIGGDIFVKFVTVLYSMEFAEIITYHVVQLSIDIRLKFYSKRIGNK